MALIGQSHRRWTFYEETAVPLAAFIDAFWGQFENDAEWHPLGLWCGNGNRPAIAAGAYRGYEPVHASSLQSS